MKLLVDAFQSDRLAEELAGKIAVKSDGNPFFVFELIRGLREGEFISRRPDGTWVTTKVIEDIEIPSSVQDLIRARIAELEEDEQELLDVAACCGFEFDPGLVAEASGLKRIPALRKLAHLEMSHRMVRSVGDRFAFDHHQVQETPYGALPSALAKEYHAAIGDILATRHPDPEGAVAVGLCEHLYRGGRGRAAVAYLDKALSHLEDSYLANDALRLAGTALRDSEDLPGKTHANLLLRRAEGLNRLGAREDERTTLAAALRLAEDSGDSDQEARVRTALGWHYYKVANYEGALEELPRAIDLAQELSDGHLEGRAHGYLGPCHYNLGQFLEARRCAEQHLRLAMKLKDAAGEAAARRHLGEVHFAVGEYGAAKEQYELSISLDVATDHQLGQMHTTDNLGVVLSQLGDLPGATASAATSRRPGGPAPSRPAHLTRRPPPEEFRRLSP